MNHVKLTHSKKATSRLPVLLIFLFAAMDVSIIGPFLAPIVRSYSISFSWIGIILSAKNLARLIFDVPTAIFSDMFGAKLLFTISRISRIISVAMIIMLDSEIALVVAMFLYGLSMSSFYGKIEPYIIQYSNNSNKESNQKLLSSYFLMSSFVMLGCGTLSSYLFPKIGYVALGVYTIITAASSLLLLPFMPNVNIESKKREKKSFALIFKTSLKNMYENKEVANLVLSLSVINVIIWRSNNIVNITLLSMNVRPQIISIIGTVHFGCTIIGYFVTITKLKLKLKTVKIITICSFVSIAIFIPMLNWFSLLVFLVSSVVLPASQINYEKRLGSILKSGNLSTVISFTGLISSICVIFLGVLNGYLNGFLPSNTVLVITITPMLAVILLLQFIGNNK
ncbi:MAG: hypothetical protein JJW01_01375 [Alphaproteobacteria bacterium]|nr:hypothetical protein [Rickettsiales bacterium]